MSKILTVLGLVAFSITFVAAEAGSREEFSALNPEDYHAFCRVRSPAKIVLRLILRPGLLLTASRASAGASVRPKLKKSAARGSPGKKASSNQ